MLKTIDSLLLYFRPCFSRQAAFHWFVVIILGLMVRSDRLGITSIIRDLYLHPRGYETLIHFFRSSAWSLESLRLTWLQVVQRMAPLFRIQDRVVLVGDGMNFHCAVYNDYLALCVKTFFQLLEVDMDEPF